MAKYKGTVAITGPISPTDTLDMYATHLASLGQGGYRSASTIVERDAILPLRREVGMVVYVIENQKEYRLVGGILNTNWSEVVSSGGSSNGDYKIVNNLTDRDNISLNDRKIGSIVYVVSDNTEYRLVNGTSNTDWKALENSTVENYKILDSFVTMEALPTSDRKIGLTVYLSDTDEEYRLVGGTANTNWVKLSSSTGGANGANGAGYYQIVSTLLDLENYPMAERVKGLTVYVSDVDQEYRLMKGIDNTNWVLVSDPVVVNVGDSTSVTNPDGSTSVINSYNYTTNNYYENNIGCLNKSLVMDTILNNVKDIATYIDPVTGNPIISREDASSFSFNIASDIYWIDDSIAFTGSTEIVTNRVCKSYISITENGITDIFDITLLLASPGIDPRFEIKGTVTDWKGYFKFSTFGQKDIKIWEEFDGIKSYNLNKTLYIFAPNFVVKDGTSTTPLNLIETSGNPFISKEYDITLPINTSVIVSLVKVNTTEKGIDTSNYSVVQNTTGILNTTGIFKITFANIRSQLVDSKYALLIKGTENGVELPPYFFGPFIIDLI